jgi:hypothetical protein
MDVRRNRGALLPLRLRVRPGSTEFHPLVVPNQLPRDARDQAEEDGNTYRGSKQQQQANAGATHHVVPEDAHQSRRAKYGPTIPSCDHGIAVSNVAHYATKLQRPAGASILTVHTGDGKRA